jgi:signal peptidase II
LNDKTVKEPQGYASYAIWVSLSILVIGLDQLTKWVIIKWVDLYDKVPVNSFINITHQRNTGAAFSFLANAAGWQRWFFIVLGVTVSCVIVVWLWRIRREGQVVLSAGLSLVLGGAIGNVIDRIIHGYVIDFIQVLILGWPFPSFNVADSAITVGAAFLIFDALFLSGSRESEGSESIDS